MGPALRFTLNLIGNHGRSCPAGQFRRGNRPAHPVGEALPIARPKPLHLTGTVGNATLATRLQPQPPEVWMDLCTLLADESATIQQVAAFLEGLEPDIRKAAVLALGRKDQRRLWQKAASSAPLDVYHFVPAHQGTRTAVRHFGRNTLPLPGKHKYFSKVFARPEDNSDRAFGFNDAPSGKLIGPGYFVARSTATEPNDPAWAARGAWVVDYFLCPDGPVPEQWPKVVENTVGLQRFVYFHTRDFMRRVSRDVAIGAAYKEEKSLDHYFVLVREP